MTGVRIFLPSADALDSVHLVSEASASSIRRAAGSGRTSASKLGSKKKGIETLNRNSQDDNKEYVSSWYLIDGIHT